MHRHFALAVAVLLLGLGGGSAICAEMVVPGGAIGGGAAALESDGPARDEAVGANVRGTPTAAASPARAHLQPDSTNEPRGEGARANVGADGSSSEFTPKAHHRGPWQSLLPGVMK